MILLSQNAIANQPPPLILSHFLLIKLWVPKIQKQIQQNEFIQGNPLAIGFRAIVMLIFILYANKIRGESNWQYSKPHRLQGMGCAGYQINK